jgi:transcriptional regulator with XRE-family HTH domain
MRLQEIGFRLRAARLEQRRTQAQLAKAAGVSRTTLNQLESGLVIDLSVQRLRAILREVGLDLVLGPSSSEPSPDFIRMAANSASVSYRTALSEDELIRVLLTGKVPASRRPHFRTLLEEASPALLQGLVQTIGQWTKPGRIEKNLITIANEIKPKRKVEEWLKSA